MHLSYKDEHYHTLFLKWSTSHQKEQNFEKEASRRAQLRFLLQDWLIPHGLFPPHSLFFYKFCYTPFHPIILPPLLWNDCFHEGFAFMKKPTRVTRRQRCNTTMTAAFEFYPLDTQIVLWKTGIATNLGLSTVLWPHRFLKGPGWCPRQGNLHLCTMREPPSLWA